MEGGDIMKLLSNAIGCTVNSLDKFIDGMNANVTLHRVSENEKDIFKNLMQFFAYDFSELNKMDINENGVYHQLPDVEEYYSDSNYTSFFIKVEGKLAGLVVVKKIAEENVSYLRHFFVMRKYRRLKVGETAANMIFDMFSGKWRVSQFDFNEPAIFFWRKIIERYTESNYIETRRKDGRGIQQEFLSKVY